MKLFRRFEPEGRKHADEGKINSKQDLVDIYTPKLRLAKVDGFEGLKIVAMKLN